MAAMIGDDDRLAMEELLRQMEAEEFESSEGEEVWTSDGTEREVDAEAGSGGSLVQRLQRHYQDASLERECVLHSVSYREGTTACGQCKYDEYHGLVGMTREVSEMVVDDDVMEEMMESSWKGRWNSSDVPWTASVSSAVFSQADAAEAPGHAVDVDAEGVYLQMAGANDQWDVMKVEIVDRPKEAGPHEAATTKWGT